MKEIRKKFYLKKLYLHAAKNIMDMVFAECSKYINYSEIQFYPCNTRLEISDPYFAYFHYLCCYLSDNYYKHDTVYYILSPLHSKKVIVSMIIPQRNITITNSQTSSKVHNLYNYPGLEIYNKYICFAQDFYLKHEKIQQDL